MESEKSQQTDRKINIGCITTIVILLTFITVFIVIQIRDLYPDASLFVADESDSFDVARAFAYSLSLNKMDGMKSYLAREKWEFVNLWTEIHKPISKKCHYLWDPDLRGMAVGGSDSTDSISISLYYIYDCLDYGYKFEINMLRLKLVDKKWQIVGWEKICEQRDEDLMCLDSDATVWRSE